MIKILHESKLKVFADDKMIVVQMMFFVFDKVENSGKRIKCWLPVNSLRLQQKNLLKTL